MSFVSCRSPKNISICKQILLFAFPLSLLLFSCTTSEEIEVQQPVTPDRFELVEKINFQGKDAKVVIDKETGIKYLYVWDGHAYGGVAITRLWDK